MVLEAHDPKLEAFNAFNAAAGLAKEKDLGAMHLNMMQTVLERYFS